MKRFIQTVSCLAVFSFFSFAFGQREIDIKPSILDEVRASSWVKTPEDFKLKGNVKQLMVPMNNLVDTISIVRFNENGHLIYEKTNDLLTEYSFDGTVLKKVKIVNLQQDTRSHLFFNSNGQLSHKEIRSKRDGEKRKITVTYSYKNQWEKISLDYAYSYDISHWDVVLGEEYTLKFDSLDRISVIYSKSRHPETTYGATKSYGYHPENGKLNHVSFIDDNAGSNSALSLILSIQYNDEDSTFIESMVDYTVRNSMWSYGYSVKKKMNRFGEVVVVKNLKSSLDIPLDGETAPKETVEPPQVSYAIDSRGNWTEQTTIIHTGEKVVAQRSIEYY